MALWLTPWLMMSLNNVLIMMWRLDWGSIIYQDANRMKRKSRTNSNTKEQWLEIFIGYSSQFQLRTLKLINSLMSLSARHRISSFNFNSSSFMCYPSKAIFDWNNISKAVISNRRETNSYSSVKSEPNRSKFISCFSQCQSPWNGLLDRVWRIQHQCEKK